MDGWNAHEEIERSRRAGRRSNARLQAFTLINEAAFGSDPSLPLNGLAVGVKDLYDTADLPTTYGSAIYRDHRPAKDAWLVERLRMLGAYVVGKTVTTEFAWRQAGPTVNPYNPAHSPGGSSSGSAAAVAAGIVPLALGTQTFGSIVRPAAFCGIVGFKPSHGALPLHGVHPLSPSLDHAGYLARSVGHIRHVHGLVVGRDRPTRASKALRLGLIRGCHWDHASPSQRGVVERSAQILREGNVSVTDAELPAEFDDGLALAETILACEAAAIYRPLIDRWPDLVSRHIKELVGKGEVISDGAYRDALARRDALGQRLRREMQDYDAILTLPALGEAPLLTEGTGDPAPCVLWTLLGAPTATVPFGFGRHGLPLGIQLVGARDDDFSFLDACVAVEALLRSQSRLAEAQLQPT
jgi:amidase